MGGTYSLYLVCFSGCFRDHEGYSLSLRLHHINLTSVLSKSCFYKLVLSWFSIGSVLRCTHILTRIQHVRCAAEVLCFVYVMMGLTPVCISVSKVRMCVSVCVVSNSCEAPVGCQEEWQASILSIPRGQTLSPQETTPTPHTGSLPSHEHLQVLKQPLFRNKIPLSCDIFLDQQFAELLMYVNKKLTVSDFALWTFMSLVYCTLCFFPVFTSCLVLFYWSKFWVTALFLMRLDLAGAQACYNNPGSPGGVIT